MRTSPSLLLGGKPTASGWPLARSRLACWTTPVVFVGFACAIANIFGALSGATNDPDACLSQGDSYLAAHDYDKAIRAYTRAIALKPALAEAYNNRAYAAYSKYDGTGDPLTDLNRALELKPDFAHAYNTRGCVYMAAGKPDRAIADFNRAIGLQPDYPRAYRNRANSYLRKGRFGLAFADFKRAGANPWRAVLYVSVALAFALALVATGVYRWFFHPRRSSREALAADAADNGSNSSA